MKKTLKALLFDSQVPEGALARKEQIVIATAMVLFVLIVFAVHIYGQGI